MHAGPYDDEPATIDAMRAFIAEQGYAPDFGGARLHHEICLSDQRKCTGEAQDRDSSSHQANLVKRSATARPRPPRFCGFAIAGRRGLCGRDLTQGYLV